MTSKLDDQDDKELGVVEQRKMEFRGRYKEQQDLVKLAKTMRSVSLTVERLKDELALANAEYDVLRLEVIPALMEAQNIERQVIKFDNDYTGRLGLTSDAYVSVKKGCKDDFFAWLKKNKFGSLIIPGVNSSTLKAFVKGRITSGKPIPDKLLNVTPYTRASITKE